MTATRQWSPGDRIVYREVLRGRVWSAKPVTVVLDTIDLVGLYLPAGTHCKFPGDGYDRRSDHWPLVDKVWQYTDVLHLITPGAAHALWVMWDTGHVMLRCWYINLQEPIRRTPIGFDTMDHVFDVVVSPDQSDWRWKDEEQLARGRCIGLYTDEEARAIRAEAERAVGLMQAGESPWCDGWEHWRPPAGWSIPELPLGWAAVPPP